MDGVNGLHHITAIAGPAQENLDFYAGILGMRLVKRSVNQDDPGTYHLFYADAEGHPGADLTFFPWAELAPPRLGHGLAVEVGLEVPAGSLGYWESRLEKYGVRVGAVDIRETPQGRRGAWGVGSVHHLAWRVADEQHQLAMRSRVEAVGTRPTPVIDRFWFKSVYFREPGGVLFEIATDGPGFAVDEEQAHLGETLVLPPWLEPDRERIEQVLPTLTLREPITSARED